MKNRLKTTIARTAVLLLLMLTIVVPDLTAGSQVSVSDNLAAIGDRINLKIIVKTTSQVDRIKLKSAENVFEVVDQLDTQKRQEEHYTVFEKNITIAFFKTGDFNVGPFEVELLKDEKTLEIRETNSIPVTIKSVLKEEDKDIKPLKSLIELEGDPFYILKYVILAVLIVAAVL
ncbi:MAG: hypothetical protein GY765_33720, partial [bacterium]|nr:hypothetical protein [bacterium]